MALCGYIYICQGCEYISPTSLVGVAGSFDNFISFFFWKAAKRATGQELCCASRSTIEHAKKSMPNNVGMNDEQQGNDLNAWLST